MRLFRHAEVAPSESNAPALLRGTACLPCRKRKMRCDAQEGGCGPCRKNSRLDECTYDDVSQWSKERKLKYDLEVSERKLSQKEAELESLKLQLMSYRATGKSVPPATAPPVAVASGFGLIGHDTGVFILTDDNESLYSELFRVEMPILEHMPHVSENTGQALFNAFKFHCEKHFLDAAFLAKRFEFDASSPKSHPSLLNSIYMLGCRYSNNLQLQRYIPIFRQKTQYHLQGGSAGNQRGTLDQCHAACLLGQYFFFEDCLGQAREVLQRAIHFLPAFFANLYESNLLSAGEQVTYDEIMRMLRHIFITDRLLSAYTGNEVLFPADIQMGKFFSDICNPTEQYGISQPFPSLYGDASWAAPPFSAFHNRYLSSLKAKAAALMSQGATADALRNDNILSELHKLKDHLPAATYTAVSNPLDFTATATTQSPPVLGNLDLSAATLQIQMLTTMLHITPSEDVQTLETTYIIEELLYYIEAIPKHGYGSLSPILGICCQWGIQYLLGQLAIFAKGKDAEDFRTRLCYQIKTILGVLLKLSLEYPIAAVNVANVAQLCEKWGILIKPSSGILV